MLSSNSYTELFTLFTNQKHINLLKKIKVPKVKNLKKSIKVVFLDIKYLVFYSFFLTKIGLKTTQKAWVLLFLGDKLSSLYRMSQNFYSIIATFKHGQNQIEHPLF